MDLIKGLNDAVNYIEDHQNGEGEDMENLNKDKFKRIEDILKTNRAIKITGTGQYFEHILKADAVKLYNLLFSQ